MLAITGLVIAKSHAGRGHTVTKVKLLLADKSEIFREGLTKLLEHEQIGRAHV